MKGCVEPALTFAARSAYVFFKACLQFIKVNGFVMDLYNIHSVCLRKVCLRKLSSVIYGNG